MVSFFFVLAARPKLVQPSADEKAPAKKGVAHSEEVHTAWRPINTEQNR